MTARHLSVWSFTLLLALLMSACTVTPPTPGRGSESPAAATVPTSPLASAALAGTEWVAFAIDGMREVTNPKPKLRWVSADKVVGNGGCNGFTGPSQLGPKSFALGPLASTGRACLSMPGSQEDLFFKALELTRSARLEHDQLVFMDAAGKQLARFMKAN